MTPNLEIPANDRCPRCKGQKELWGGVCTISWHPAEKSRPCPDCEATGLNKEALAKHKRAERAEAKKKEKVS
jgi:rubredoxin